jgi:hypothetical protein
MSIKLIGMGTNLGIEASNFTINCPGEIRFREENYAMKFTQYSAYRTIRYKCKDLIYPSSTVSIYHSHLLLLSTVLAARLAHGNGKYSNQG